MKLALHRSIIFWVGMVLIPCTLWAWWDSRRYESTVCRKHVILQSTSSGISFRRDPEFSASRWMWQRELQSHLYPGVDPASWVPASFVLRGDEESALREPVPTEGFHKDSLSLARASSEKSYRHVFVPYWMILLAMAGPWLVLVAWQARRRMRKLGLLLSGPLLLPRKREDEEDHLSLDHLLVRHPRDDFHRLGVAGFHALSQHCRWLAPLCDSSCRGN